jgi:hypothetical protein
MNIASHINGSSADIRDTYLPNTLIDELRSVDVR